MIYDLLKEFQQKISYKTIHNSSLYDSDLAKLYREIVNALSHDYDAYINHISLFLTSLEESNTESLPFAIPFFMEQYEALISIQGLREFDLSIMEHEADKTILVKYKSIFESDFADNHQIRISKTELNLSILDEKEKKDLASLIIHKLQEDAKQLNWDKRLVEDALMLFVFIRQLLLSLNAIELFYHVAGIFFDRLSSSEHFQAGRDIAEEINISSFTDEVPELGFFNSYRIYSNLNSVHAALVYANLSMRCCLRKTEAPSVKYVKEVIWQSVKFFRNVGLYHWCEKVYRKVPDKIGFSKYEKRSLDHTYLSSLLKQLKPDFPAILLDYLSQQREEILKGGYHDAYPWLLTLYNVRRLYPEADFSTSGFGFYINVFELIVLPDSIKKYKTIVEGNSSELKGYLKESLIKLNETRNKKDFVYDNSSALKISSRAIEYSSVNTDPGGFLLAMMLKSDYSILFKEKSSKGVAPLILPDIDIDSFDTIYENKDTFTRNLELEKNQAIIWLAVSEAKLFQLILQNQGFSFNQAVDWSNSNFNALANDGYFVDFTFEETIKDKGGVRLISPEEFKEATDEIANNLKFAKLKVPDETNAVLLVKDMQLSKFPHNLFLSDQNDFLAAKYPVSNILSTEWYLLNQNEPLVNNFSKAIWIPVETGDIPLNYLYSNIEDSIKTNNFEVHTQSTLISPLTANVNIICSHGGKNISEVQIISQEDNITYDLDQVIGEGRVLIFFVCYSGSMKSEFFRNNVSSIVKRFIAKGYDAVIAPCWALDVTIPRYWLPKFLEAFEAGLTISEAFFAANMKVKEVYPTPAAWACLHLYGNPNLRVDKEKGG